VAFRIVTSDGTSYDIPHPEMVLPFPTSVEIAYRNDKVPGTFLRSEFVSMSHIVRVEILDSPASAHTQGNNETGPHNGGASQ
jgi:hypothetical protein